MIKLSQTFEFFSIGKCSSDKNSHPIIGTGKWKISPDLILKDGSFWAIMVDVAV